MDDAETAEAARAMASWASVTESMAADTTGMASSMRGSGGSEC
ncbi:MAG: hypothetical protein WKF43_08990 [Acidimicrobiales bacterium]